MEKTQSRTPVNLFQALVPLALLIVLLYINSRVFGDGATSGPNQFALILAGLLAGWLGLRKGISYDRMLEHVSQNIAQTSGAIMILLFVGALSGIWLLSGIIPTMIYYGLQLLNPQVFLATALVIAAVVSVTTGSSWNTTATVGIALMSIGKAMGYDAAMIAGAVISGAYFGDKISPLSDTTNLASAVAGTDLFTHVRYMLYTTVPSITLAFLIFLLLGWHHAEPSAGHYAALLEAIRRSFNVSPWLFTVPLVVIVLIVLKTRPLVALFTGIVLGAVAALIFQRDLLAHLAGTAHLGLRDGYRLITQSIVGETSIPTDEPLLKDLFSGDGMTGMLSTIWLIISAMFFGGVMEAVGALKRISLFLLQTLKGIFGLFAATDLTCILFNATASDQYLAIVVPGKMYKQAFDDAGLAPENLSRTLEDSGTVTSVLIPWNTGGAYNSKMLGVPTQDYWVYAFFNLISPVMTLIFAYFRIKIRFRKG